MEQNVLQSWVSGQKFLLGLESVAKENNAEFMVVNIPFAEEINSRGLPKNIILNTTRMENFSKDNGINYCDVKDTLKNNPEGAFYKVDKHLTPTGNKLMSIAIENCLLENNLLPLRIIRRSI